MSSSTGGGGETCGRKDVPLTGGAGGAKPISLCLYNCIEAGPQEKEGCPVPQGGGEHAAAGERRMSRSRGGGGGGGAGKHISLCCRAAGEGRMSSSTGGEGGNMWLQEKEGCPVPQRGGGGKTFIVMPI